MPTEVAAVREHGDGRPAGGFASELDFRPVADRFSWQPGDVEPIDTIDLFVVDGSPTD